MLSRNLPQKKQESSVTTLLSSFRDGTGQVSDAVSWRVVSL